MNRELLMQLWDNYLNSYSRYILGNSWVSNEVAFDVMETNKQIFFNTLEEEISNMIDKRIFNILTDEQLNDMYVQSHYRGFGQ